MTYNEVDLTPKKCLLRYAKHLQIASPRLDERIFFPHQPRLTITYVHLKVFHVQLQIEMVSNLPQGKPIHTARC